MKTKQMSREQPVVPKVLIPRGWKYLPHGSKLRRTDKYVTLKGEIKTVIREDWGHKINWDAYPKGMYYIRKTRRPSRAKGRKK